jgi:hypothetical protein
MKRFAFGALVVAGLLAPLGFVPAGNGGAGTEPARQAADTVWIDIVADGESIAANPDSVSARQGQPVGWRSELGNWRVIFHSPQPFGQGGANPGLAGDRGQRRAWTVRPDATPQLYKYDILVVIPGRGAIRVDPEIAIQPGGRP